MLMLESDWKKLWFLSCIQAGPLMSNCLMFMHVFEYGSWGHSKYNPQLRTQKVVPIFFRIRIYGILSRILLARKEINIQWHYFRADRNPVVSHIWSENSVPGCTYVVYIFFCWTSLSYIIIRCRKYLLLMYNICYAISIWW